MKVIIINDGNHGVIGIANDYESAVHYLVSTSSLPTDIYDDEYEEWITIDDLLGDEWYNEILLWSLDHFNRFFEGFVSLRVEEVYNVH